MIIRYVLGIALAAAVAYAGVVHLRLSATKDELQAVASAYDAFRMRAAEVAADARAKAQAETARLEKQNADIVSNYDGAVRRLADLQRVRRAAESAARTGGGGVPAAAEPAPRADAALADTGPRADGPATPETEGTVIERCQAATVQCAWLQYWAAGLVPVGKP